jgi:nucleoside 2-deoxyribosyltransferase
MQQAKNIGTAFAMGVMIAEGKISEAVVNDWLETSVSFHAAHATAADTCDPDELRGALRRAIDAGKLSGINIPVPTAPGGGQ